MMAGESQHLPEGVPDPSVFTTEALARGLDAERDYTDAQLAIRDERLRGIDVATRLLNETVNRVPTDMQREVSHLRELAFERMESLHRELGSLGDSITLQFTERDTRSEREARDNTKAVDAAFAAQEKAAVEQNRSNQLAIAKSEAQTTDAIAKLGELNKTTTDALASQISDNKDALAALALDLKQTRAGNQGSDSGRAAIYAGLIALVTIVIMMAGVGLTIANLAGR